MKTLRKMKKGFTIVELVIVIAVIAVLTAILVPTFISISNKADKASDTSLVTNLNTALKMAEGDNEIYEDHKLSDANECMHDAVLDLKAYGFNIDQLVTKSDQKLLYSLRENRFYLSDNEEIATKYPTAAEKVQCLWAVQNSLTGNEIYSVYAGPRWTETSVTGLKVGFDVGSRTNIESISYQNSTTQKVVIRTNGGTLTVNAPADTVKHYGDAQVVTLTAVGTSSYYEHGSVNLVDIKKGRLVITNDTAAEVGTIYLSATNDAYDGIILATQSGSELPEVVARESVSIPTTGEKLVVTIQTNVDGNGENPTKTEEIKLYPTSDVKEATNGYDVSDLGLLVVEAISSEGQTQAAAQITDAAVLESVKESNVSTKEEVTAAATEFAGGKGTQANPWLIVDYDTFQNVSNHYSDDEFHYWKCKDNLVINATDWTPVNLYGSIEGNGVVLNNLDNTLFSNTWNDRDNNGNPINIVKISNMILNCSIFATSSTAALVRTAADDLYVDNVDIHGQVVGYSVGGYVDYGSGNFGSYETRNWQVTFKDCDNDAQLVSYGEGVGGFIQHPYSDTSDHYDGDSLITIIDSAYTGKMTSVSNMDYFAYQNNHIHVKTTYSSSFISKLGFNPEGTLYKTMNKDESGMFDAGNYSGAGVPSGIGYPSNGNSAGTYRPNDSTNSTYKLEITSSGSNPANYGDSYTFTKVNGATTSKIAFMISPNERTTESGSYTGTYVSEEINISALSNGDTFNTDKIRYWTIAINPDDATETGISGTQFNVVNDFYGKTHNGANIYAVQYASNGEVVGITKVTVCASNAVSVRYNGSLVKSAGAGATYTYDCGEDLSGKTITIKIYDRKVATWTYTYEANEVVKTLQEGTDFTVSGSTIIINNVEGIKLRNTDLYNYFKEYCRYVITVE